ncbi:MAG: hypothetical protein OH335_04390 [Candidatus Parvarchaeota archaeon]|nr:hypothetical protein [Candidatus Jingweiarchaeum tengchongense]MCW1305985.1 hypothetical protein [Candidatus Jingweiarchaeum tengchongense]
MERSLTLLKSLSNIVVDPKSLQPLSSTGQPTTAYNLLQGYPIGIIGFQVPEGVYWIVQPNPIVRMVLWQDDAGTTPIASGDTINFYSKAPSDPPTSLGTLITTVPYDMWSGLSKQQQMVGQYASNLKLPIDKQFKISQNEVLIVAVASLLSTETVNWTDSYISIPVIQVTNS